MNTSKLGVQGLDCADESAELRQMVGKLTDVRELSFAYLQGLMFVDHDESVASTTRLNEGRGCGWNVGGGLMG